MLSQLTVKPCYVYNQYKNSGIKEFFNNLNEYKQLQYYSNAYQPLFYANLDKIKKGYTLFWLKCIYGFNYNFAFLDKDARYYDSNYLYDSNVDYDVKLNAQIMNVFYNKVFQRKNKGNKIFTLCDFVELCMQVTNTSYYDYTIEILYPRTTQNKTSKILYNIVIKNVEVTTFNLLKSYLVHIQSYLPLSLNYSLNIATQA